MDHARLGTVTVKTSPIPDEVADDLLPGADRTPGSVPPAPTAAIEGQGESRDEADSRSWRGVFAVEYPEEILFTKRIDIRPDQLDEWKPESISVRGHSEHDD